MGMPLGNLLLPEQHPVERIASDQVPLRREQDRRAGRLVEDVEDTAIAGDHSAQARQMVVMPAHLRTCEPLDVPRRSHERILGNGVSAGGVQIMRPLVHRPRPRLPPSEHSPAVQDDAIRRQHTSHVLGHCTVADHNTHGIRDERNAVSVPATDGHLPGHTNLQKFGRQ